MRRLFSLNLSTTVASAAAPCLMMMPSEYYSSCFSAARRHVSSSSISSSSSSSSSATPRRPAAGSQQQQQLLDDAQRSAVLAAAQQVAQRQAQGSLPSSSSSSSSGMTGSRTTTVSASLSAAAVESTSLRQEYKEAVQQRIVGNAALRKLVKNLHSSQFQHAIDAIEGAKAGGLVIDSDTCEVYLGMLLEAGQLRQAMEVYHYMLSHRVCPNTSTYNQLMELCLAKQSWDGALTLFSEMQRRGRQPDVVSYENALNALSIQEPPNWVKAVQVFDKLQRNKAAMSSNTYDALIKVYMAMEPFDWRVVYNAYLEMRSQKPKVQFGWPSYELVAEAMRRGGAGKLRRLTTFADAWIQITPPFSLAMLRGLTTFIFCIMSVRIAILYTIKSVREAMAEKSSESDVIMD